MRIQCSAGANASANTDTGDYHAVCVPSDDVGGRVQ